MILEEVISPLEIGFLIKFGLSLVFGTFIGIERELRGKPAGVSTQTLVIGGSMLFTSLSLLIDPNSPARIAAQIVVGVGFLGAGIIFVQRHQRVLNLTTAASIWFAAAIGMTLGYGLYIIAATSAIFALLVPRLPSITKEEHHDHKSS
jgi:putative Mg2+ transporter-C (MgtC) family protein